MSHSLSNKAARASAKRKLLSAFNTSVISAELLPFWKDEYSPFMSEIKKANLTWLSESDIHLIMMFTYFEAPKKSKTNGRMSEIHDKQFLDELAERIIDGIASPNGYWFYFPLPQICLQEEIELSDSVIFTNKKVQIKRSLLGDISDDPNYIDKAYLKVRGVGFVFNDRTHSAFVDAITKAKVALQILGLSNFIHRVPKKRGALDLMLGGNHQADIYEVEYVADRKQEFGTSKVMLSIGFSNYLTEISFTEGKWAETKAASLKHHVGRVLHAFNDPAALENIKSIRRSLEWSFDAGIDEDEHMRFIKTCIGLEAAVAEQNEEIGITEQLADRCAFLLDKTALDRQETRNTMRQIYKLRSKLVHGVAAGLSGAEKRLAFSASEILKAVLKIELKAVMDWYDARRERTAATALE